LSSNLVKIILERSAACDAVMFKIIRSNVADFYLYSETTAENIV